MSLEKEEFARFIKEFDFKTMFIEMGWNHDKARPETISIEQESYKLESIVEKSGFRILLCYPMSDGSIPLHTVRKKIDTKVTRLFEKHLIIYFDAKKTKQIWQFVVRQSGKPSKTTETIWTSSQDPELLYQRASGIFFELDEEDKITIIDVTQRIAKNFQQNNEKITKKFYVEFKKEHSSFLKFIVGIQERADQEWYASLMLNRLMFCYFIQKKGFLDDNRNYLREKLVACKKKKGKDKFYSFYRDFLLILFHQGLNAPDRKKELEVEIGKIPYLNGGLFDVHELEKKYNDIKIEDKAFEKLFDFFDLYEWHLDTRETASGRDINPDVIGYIFEKYINDRANMGAYYTKEDITDYISKNSIIPYLFEETERSLKKAESSKVAKDIFQDIWNRLQVSGDDYIYDSVKKGGSLELPPDIAIGVDTTKPDLLDRRKNWNQTAPVKYALPTEIWREVVDRRSRYHTVRDKIEKGEIHEINDLITYNLDIKQFAQDIVEELDSPEFIEHFYKSLNSVTVLDPTCGSGAFLFAAMNILEPLYESSLERMTHYVNESKKGQYKYFENIISTVDAPEHPNRKYHIYKNIILNNLYGVDIMREAVEIAKLRLFLKLVATVEPDYTKNNMGLEPLPDIDFNIRSGNSLVGFANEKELIENINSRLDYDKDIEYIKEKCEMVGKSFQIYKDIQLKGESATYKDYGIAKTELIQRLNDLREELNILLAKDYNISLGKNKGKSGQQDKYYEEWLESHQPFHWFSEFYEIVHERSGFDVVIGNPPYVVYNKKDSKTKKSIYDKYKIQNYLTASTNNLYAFCYEMSCKISKDDASISMILPISSVSSNSFKPLRDIILRRLISWQSSYSNRPGKLFDGVEQRLSIILGRKMENREYQYFSSSYKHWYSDNRKFLFESLFFSNNRFTNLEPSFCKAGSDVESSVKEKLFQKVNIRLEYYIDGSSTSKTYYHNGPTYFIRSMSFEPNNSPKLKASSHYKELQFKKNLKQIPCAILNSSIFYFFYKNYSNCRDFSDREIIIFPVGEFSKEMIYNLDKWAELLKSNYIKNKKVKNRNYNGEIVYYEEFYPAQSKHIIDEIDKALAQHYGFTEEELDYIINYDIKYRMGKELETEEESE